MFKTYKLYLALMIIGILAISGCSSSFQTAIDEALVAVEEEFQAEQKEVNRESKEIDYYLPFGYEVEEETPNNIILKNGAKTYILFYNPQEDESSDIVLQATTQQKDFDITETFEENERLGFFLVRKMNEDLNEVTVGIGGVKVTGEVKTRSLKSEARAMMTIVNSVQVN